MVDRYRINLNYKYENMSTRYDIPENGSFTATYSNDQTKYTIFDTKGNEICKFNVDYQKERPVHEYVYPNHVSYIEVLPNFTNRDRLIDSALGSLNIAIIPIVLSISMICCVTFFYKKKLLEKDNIIAGDDVCFYPLLLYVFYHILINIAWYLTDFSNNI